MPTARSTPFAWGRVLRDVPPMIGSCIGFMHFFPALPSETRDMVGQLLGIRKRKWNSFCELMPCALEALTVIKNVLSLISYSHMLENRWKQKARCLPISNKANTTKNQNPTKKQTKTNQEDTQETRWDTTLSDEKSPSRSVLLHDVISDLIHKCPKWLKVSKLWLAVVLHHPSHWTRVRSWFTHVLVSVDEAAQGRRTIEIEIATIQIPENKETSR